MTSAAQAPVRQSWLVRGLIAANLFVIVVVNVCIYWARYAFARDYPEATGQTIPTISGALSEAPIRDPFALWVGISALVLACGVGGMVWLWSRAIPSENRGLRLLAFTVAPMQWVACLGMVVLSQYTFPDYRDAHMAGSYMFFVAQSLVIVLCFVLSRMLIRRPDVLARMVTVGVHLPAPNRARVVMGGVIIAMVLVYLVLFIGKDFLSRPLKQTVTVVYVNLESLCITAYLLFLGLYQIDLWRGLNKAKA